MDYRYINSILNKNLNKLIFLGNKRIPNANNLYKSQNQNNLKKKENINKKKFPTNGNKILLDKILNKCLQKKKNNYQNFEKNCEKKNYDKKKILFANNETNIEYNLTIQNKNINLSNKELLNNTKKILRYNKIVYVNKFLIKEKKNKKNNGKNKRSSKYRGVSKNGLGWQVLMMLNNNNSYIGTYYSEDIAARIYDILQIKKNGINAKTNFIYNNEQIVKILETNIDLKNPNISKVISELIK